MVGASLATRAVIFVHGWGGSPEATWYEFQDLIDDDHEPDAPDWWRHADLYFYSYESRRFSIAEHVAAFLEFLDGVFPSPPKSIPHLPDGSPQTEKYIELYLVGHSLGGVVLRESILDRAAIAQASKRATTKSIALLNGQLRLFAPAMHGAEPSGWLGLTYHLLSEIKEIKPWFNALAESSTIIRQLSRESDKLKRLHDETDRLATVTDYPALVADVVYGEKEHIVERDKFRLDKIALPRPGMGHKSICKPHERYRYPLRFVVRGTDAK